MFESPVVDFALAHRQTLLVGYFVVGVLIEVCDWSVGLLRKARIQRNLRERLLQCKANPELSFRLTPQEWEYVSAIWKRFLCWGTLSNNDVDHILKILEFRVGTPPAFNLCVAAMISCLWPIYLLAKACSAFAVGAGAIWFGMEERLQTVMNKAWHYLTK